MSEGPAGVDAATLEVLHTLRDLVFNAEVPFERQRAVFAMAALALEPGPGVTLDEVEVGGVACARLTPEAARENRALVYVHGGGYCIGTPAMGYALGAVLATALRATWYGVHYRLAPEHRAPCAVDDVAAVLGALGGREVVALGDSAGAGALSAAVARDVASVRAMALVSPWLDLAAAHDAPDEPLLSAGWLAACAAAYAGEHVSDAEASPLRASWSQMPPTLVVASGDEILAGDARRLDEATGDNVEVHVVAGLWHDFALWARRLGAADDAAALIGEHLARHAEWDRGSSS